MHDDAGREQGQDLIEQPVDVGAWHQDVAGIDEENVARL